MIGIGVMLRELAGNERSLAAYKASIGKEITRVWICDDDALHFRFADGSGLCVSDQGQSCCEHRYMRTDDDLDSFVGDTLVGIQVKDAPDEVDEYGETHEVQFLEINTNRGTFTVANHNEHNGYYGGFSIECAIESDQ
jgi:hypothetical protein